MTEEKPCTSKSVTSEGEGACRMFVMNRRTGDLIPIPTDIIPDEEFSDEENVEKIVAEAKSDTRNFTKRLRRIVEVNEVDENSNETISHPPKEEKENLTFERLTNCIGEPQAVPHGFHLNDMYQMHRHKICTKRMQERATRMKMVEYNLPVPQLQEFTDNFLLEELNAKFGEMDMEDIRCQSLFITYKKGRLDQVTKWIEEESFHRMNRSHEGESQTTPIKEFMKHLIPISNFTPQDLKAVKEISLEDIFPTTGNYYLDEVKSLNMTSCKCVVDHFDLPRKPCMDPDCKKAGESRPTSQTALNDETPNEFMDQLEKIEEWMQKFILGITPSQFWKSYVNEHKLEEASLAAILGVSKLEQFCHMRPSLFHVPQKENTLNLMYPGYISKHLKYPSTIFYEIWHDIKVLMGGYSSAETQASVLTRDIQRLLKLSATALEIDPTDWGFRNCEEFCNFLILEYEPPGIYKIITFTKDKNNAGSTLMALTKANKKKLAAEMELLKKIESQRLAAIPPPNRIRKLNELRINNPLFMDKPEKVIRIPVTRGTVWSCFPDNVEEGFPLELSVHPKVFKELAVDLQTLMMEKWSCPRYKLLRIKFNKKLPNPKKLVEGIHVVVEYGLASPRKSISDDSSPPKFQFHRGILLEYFHDEEKWLVELYDRGIAMLVDDDLMQFMSPEVYCHSPAMATRVRLHLSKDYKRVVETEFKFLRPFDETDVAVMEGLLDEEMPFDVEFLEEFPSDLCYERFWKVSITSYYFSRQASTKNELIKSRNAEVILLKKFLRARIDEVYREYCQDSYYVPLEQKYPDVKLAADDVVDLREQTLKDFFDLTDPLW